MTEFATRPLPLTFMPSIPMANRRPKRKSGTNTFLDDATIEAPLGGDSLPPLKKTKRSSPDGRATSRNDGSSRLTSQFTKSKHPPVTIDFRQSDRITLTIPTGSAGEAEENTDNIFSKGPSRAKRAKQKQKENQDQDVIQVQQLPKPPKSSEEQTSETILEPSSPTRTRRSRAIPSKPNVKKPGLGDEVSQPAQPTTRSGTSTRKSRANNVTTPTSDASRVRRSPRLKSTQNNDAQKLNHIGNERPLTVPLAAIEDTPLVRKRNKEMREAKGHRRSSLGLRGRRASSLNNGYIACPHPDVQTNDFFKHLDAEMIETQRMQQLLAWCAKRALSDKRARGRDVLSNARAAARVIEEEILADLTEKKLNINWWDTSEQPRGEKDEQKKPHPRNEDHARKIASLEKQLNELNQEKQLWLNIGERNPQRLSKKLKEGTLRLGDLDSDLLRPEEVATMPGFEQSDKSIGVIQEVLSRGRGSLEFKIDQFSHGVHKAQQLSRHAKGVSEIVLSKASSVLGDREEAKKKAAGTNELPLHEVLKSISHLGRS